MTPSLDEFKELVDGVHPTMQTNDWMGSSAQLGIDTTNGFSSMVIFQGLYEVIRSAITTETGSSENSMSREEFFGLTTELFFRHVVQNEDVTSYLMIMKVINDSCRKGGRFVSFANREAWGKGLMMCKNHLEMSPDTFRIMLGSLKDDYPKQFNRATSLKYLMERGCKVEVKGDDVTVSDGLDELVNELLDKIKHYGGVNLTTSMAFTFEKHGHYSAKLERYHLVRSANMLGGYQPQHMPYGYLFNLALRFPVPVPIPQDDQKIKDIGELATHLVAGIYNVQSYSVWEYHFKTGDTIVQFCRDIILWDSIFTIPQSRPFTAVETAKSLLSFIDDSIFQSAFGFSQSELWTVVAEFIKPYTPSFEPLIIYLSTVKKFFVNIPEKNLLAILNFLAHPGEINSGFRLPAEYTQIDFGLRPLIRVGPTKFLMINRSWCAPNYFEAVASQVRPLIPEFDSTIGTQLERYLVLTFQAHGIQVLGGGYNIGKEHGECDMLIETDKAIILIEFKKKPLTRLARSGMDVNIFLDLSDSLLAAQLQTGRTEIALREQGSITLTNSSGSTTIQWNNRQIERIALTQLEYGGFQDRTITHEFLRVMLNSGFDVTSEDESVIRKFKQFEKKQDKWREQYLKLKDLNPDFENNPYFNCWFMSLPQLLEVLVLATENNSFYEALLSGKYMTQQTLDWYKEFEFATSGKFKT